MRVLQISAKNFKSFADITVDLGDVNYIIGANASGKSNFVRIFTFLRNITQHGLENAISKEGGVENLRNNQIGSSENLEIRIKYVWDKTPMIDPSVITQSVNYYFAIRFHKRGNGFSIAKDEFSIEYSRYDDSKSVNGKEESRLKVWGTTISANSKGKIHQSDTTSEESIPKVYMYINSMIKSFPNIASKSLLMEHALFGVLHNSSLLFRQWTVYDFAPRLAKRAGEITGLQELEKDGSNLAISLKYVLDDKEQRRAFYNVLSDLLPFVEGLRVKPLADRSIMFEINEMYGSDETFVPAAFISDGTANVLALIIVLYFSRSGQSTVAFFEEVERNIHPNLLGKVVDMFEDAAANNKKQVIVTTHNPEIVRYAGLENLYLVSRDEDGFSVISRPGDSAAVQTFLANDIGIDELYVQNLLGV